MSYISHLKKFYQEEGKDALFKSGGYKSIMEVPAIEKVIVTSSSKDVVSNPKSVENVKKDLYEITGQQPVITKARKSIAGFKLREGVPMGAKVTLRGDMMYDFLFRLLNVALPRSRDFKGLKSTQFDGKGNFSMGIKEQIIFPEIDYDKIDQIRGMNIIIVTSAKTDAQAKELLKVFNFPFEK